MSLQILPKNLKILYMVPFHVNSSANSLQNPPKSPKIPKIPLKMCLKLCGAEKCCPSLQSKMVGEGRSYEDLDPATLVSQEVKSVP